MTDVKPNMEDQTDLPDYEEQELATTEVAPAAQKFVSFRTPLTLSPFFSFSVHSRFLITFAQGYTHRHAQHRVEGLHAEPAAVPRDLGLWLRAPV